MLAAFYIADERDYMKNDLTDVAAYAFDALGPLGIDGAEVNVSRGRMDEFNVDAGKFSLLRTSFNASFVVRVLSGGRKGVAVINNLERGAIAQALEQAADSAKSSEPDEAEYIADGIGEHAFSLGAGPCDLDGIYARLDEFLNGCAASYPTIEPYQIISRYNSASALYANTNGTRVLTDSAQYSHGLTICARDGDRVSSMNGFGYKTDNPGAPLLENKEIKRILAETERQITTKPIDGKFVGTLLIAPDCLGELLFSVISSCATDTPLIAGSSPWMDKLGETVADGRLNIAFDPLDPRVVCGARVTGDGHLTKRQDIVRGGVLTGWALSQYGAKKTGLERSGNVSGNLIVGTGDKSFDEMLAGIENGLLLNRFSGGRPSRNGDFSGVAKNSFLIKNGKITDPVSETMISGNLLDMIKNVVEIGDEAVCDGGAAIPFAAFDGITISGK